MSPEPQARLPQCNPPLRATPPLPASLDSPQTARVPPRRIHPLGRLGQTAVRTPLPISLLARPEILPLVKPISKPINRERRGSLVRRQASQVLIQACRVRRPVSHRPVSQEQRGRPKYKVSRDSRRPLPPTPVGPQGRQANLLLRGLRRQRRGRAASPAGRGGSQEHRVIPQIIRLPHQGQRRASPKIRIRLLWGNRASPITLRLNQERKANRGRLVNLANREM